MNTQKRGRKYHTDSKTFLKLTSAFALCHLDILHEDDSLTFEVVMATRTSQELIPLTAERTNLLTSLVKCLCTKELKKDCHVGKRTILRGLRVSLRRKFTLNWRLHKICCIQMYIEVCICLQDPNAQCE